MTPKEPSPAAGLPSGFATRAIRAASRAPRVEDDLVADFERGLAAARAVGARESDTRIGRAATAARRA